MLIGFNGTGYQGMQFNPDARTIEETLFGALCKTGAVSQDNASDLKKVQFLRAARTDKGVHAAGNLVSLKMLVPGTVQDMITSINAQLPPTIRVWDAIRVQNSFNAKRSCSSRKYEYLLPTYVFRPPCPRPLLSDKQQASDLIVVGPGRQIAGYIPRSTPDEMREKRQYRIDPGTFAQFREAISLFRGTHNFHNYTVGRAFNDPSSKRHIMELQVSGPMHIDGVEWLSIKLHGQSFMLHQIRKMVSMAMLCVRSNTPLSVIDESFGETSINVPKAPALGLLLEEPVYNLYNSRVKEVPDREEIDFEKYKDTIQAFKDTQIYPQIFAGDMEKQAFDDFLLFIDTDVTESFRYLNQSHKAAL
ncbi:pseudouridine synthase [Syncephalastrum racemosum]|uniref:Pseudouridine synthase n=1 Tax=Syncephalastrum racemosum TaxID=13706 RepID=A0A1X2H820_SYNRA|nr:pseudouridine synthase [Syncephalastrum racemosum]